MDQSLAPLARLGRSLAQAQDRQLGRLAVGTRERLLEGLGAATTSRPRRLAPWLLAAAACVAVAAWALWPRALTFSVADGSTVGRLEEWIAAPAERSVPLTFSDGTSLVLGPLARARVTATDGAGAKLVVERGRIEAAVVPRPRASWRLLFGPFAVAVTGTRFVADWNPDAQQLSVDLREGSVLVTGPGLGAGHPLTAGTLLTASAVDRRFTVSSTEPEPPTATPAQVAERAVPSADASSAVPTDAGAEPVDGGRATMAAPVPRWRALYGAGKYEEALREAQRDGFDARCAQAGPAELMMLAETARYGGEPALAEQTFALVRSRLAGSPHASVAAFHLGTIAFDNRGAYGQAATWFARYLAEQPRGAMAHEATVRLIEARERSGDVAGARAAARRYLSVFPDGAHAERAKRLLAAEPLDER